MFNSFTAKSRTKHILITAHLELIRFAMYSVYTVANIFSDQIFKVLNISPIKGALKYKSRFCLRLFRLLYFGTLFIKKITVTVYYNKIQYVCIHAQKNTKVKHLCFIASHINNSQPHITINPIYIIRLQIINAIHK